MYVKGEGEDTVRCHTGHWLTSESAVVNEFINSFTVYFSLWACFQSQTKSGMRSPDPTRSKRTACHLTKGSITHASEPTLAQRVIPMFGAVDSFSYRMDFLIQTTQVESE